MRIGIEARWLSGETTGFGKYALNLLLEFNRMQPGHQFLVYVNERCENPRLFNNDRMQQVIVPWKPPFYKQAGIPLDIVWRRRRLDLFHYAYNAPALWTPGPFVLTLHDLSYLHVPEMVSWIHRTTAWWQLKWKSAQARRIITVSNFSKRDIVARLGIDDSRMDVIYHGVEPAFTRADPERQEAAGLKYALKKPFFLYVGTYLPHKNLALLIQAFQRFRARWPQPAQLVLAGRPGRNSENVKQRIRELGLEADVRLLGFVPDEDLPALYSRSAAFVYPSRFEGFGLPLIEAMACGTPVLAANTSCLPEVGGDAALYFDADDVEGLADALFRILKDGNLGQDMIERGLVRAAKFSWRSAAESTLESYDRAALALATS